MVCGLGARARRAPRKPFALWLGGSVVRKSTRARAARTESVEGKGGQAVLQALQQAHDGLGQVCALLVDVIQPAHGDDAKLL